MMGQQDEDIVMQHDLGCSKPGLLPNTMHTRQVTLQVDSATYPHKEELLACSFLA